MPNDNILLNNDNKLNSNNNKQVGNKIEVVEEEEEKEEEEVDFFLHQDYDNKENCSWHSGINSKNGCFHHQLQQNQLNINNSHHKTTNTAINGYVSFLSSNGHHTSTSNISSNVKTDSSLSDSSKSSSRLVKVLICTESFHPYTSGIARRFKEIIERLSRRGFLIHVVTGCKGSETWTNDADLKDKVTFSVLKAIEFKDKIDCALPFLLPQYGILKAILKFEPDVIHCVEHTPAATFCGAIGKTLNIPLVWSSHTNLDFYIPLYIYPLVAPISLRIYQLLRRTFLNLADYNLTVSSDFVKLLAENGVNQTVHVWKTGVDAQAFNPSYRSHEMRLRMFNGHYSPDKILLVSVGRLSPEKNFEFLLKLLENFPQTFLCIVGGGPYKESLQPLFPPNQTHFMGFLQGEQLASAYASADYFVYASVSETFGQVYLEAMSSGTPIVAAEGQQMKEFFINGIHGYTWTPEDAGSAVKALNNAIQDRYILSQNCRSNALNHSWNSAANQIADVYIKLRNKKKRVEMRNNESIFKRVLNIVVKSVRGVYYLSIWLYVTILVCTLMAPFMKVAKPISLNSPNPTQIQHKSSRTIQHTSQQQKQELIQ